MLERKGRLSRLDNKLVNVEGKENKKINESLYMTRVQRERAPCTRISLEEIFSFGGRRANPLGLRCFLDEEQELMSPAHHPCMDPRRKKDTYNLIFISVGHVGNEKSLRKTPYISWTNMYLIDMILYQGVLK